MIRLTWAQEVWSSNLHAPTILFNQLQTERLKHQHLSERIETESWRYVCHNLASIGCIGEPVHSIQNQPIRPRFGPPPKNCTARG